jgi:hypothetical protein
MDKIKLKKLINAGITDDYCNTISRLNQSQQAWNTAKEFSALSMLLEKLEKEKIISIN